MKCPDVSDSSRLPPRLQFRLLVESCSNSEERYARNVWLHNSAERGNGSEMTAFYGDVRASINSVVEGVELFTDGYRVSRPRNPLYRNNFKLPGKGDFVRKLFVDIVGQHRLLSWKTTSLRLVPLSGHENFTAAPVKHSLSAIRRNSQARKPPVFSSATKGTFELGKSEKIDSPEAVRSFT